MAESRAQDVVNEVQSMDEASSIDVSGKTFTTNGNGEGEEQSRIQGEGSGNSQATTISTYGNSFSESGAIQVSDFTSSSTFDSLPTLAKMNLQSNGQAHVETNDDSAVETVLTNGVDSASFAGSEDAGYQYLVGTDESVASDTDPNRGEGIEQTQDLSHRRERSNSVKKPASFKAVSVTKNFLAKSGAAQASTGKIAGDRVASAGSLSPITAPPQLARSRLVAKSGRDARTLSSGVGVGNTIGPDANKVWNRNRPVPPPPPKQFTDEELKQQYGIHMATRLQADEAGKESKWADIDDDEDDWAPETVQWMDGTKSTLHPSETTPLAVKTGGTPETWKESGEAVDLPAEPPQFSNSVASIGKTILRPGARVATQTKPGLVLKSVPENPSLLEKPQTSSSSKSPWASLPPVDKASPITFYPPATLINQSLSGLRRDLVVQDEEQSHAQSPPAREIAADDFDRSWREEGDRSSSRELFNSQSGRYEPVKNVRRTSRQEQGFRPPSVLQRPSQQNPAEPSAAFQSREPRSWSQRRDSSSYGSTNHSYERRASIDQESRVPPQALKPFNPQQIPPPGGDARFGPDTPQISDQTEFQGAVQPQANSAQGLDQQNPSNPGPEEDPRLVQQQLMRERIERNRKRKQDEEAREEAERKERIRLKMEALGPVSPSVSQSKPVETQSHQPVGVATSDLSNFPPSKREHVAASDLEFNDATQSSAAFSQTQTETFKNPVTSEPSVTSQSQLSSSSRLSAQQAPKVSLSDSGLPSTHNPEIELPGLGHPMPTERQARFWGRVPQNMESPNWPNKPLAQGPSNVWGPVSSDRPLGNGVFENEMNRMPSIQMPPNHHQTPGPLRPTSMSPFDAAHPTPSTPPHFQARHDGVPQPSTTISASGPARTSFQQPSIHSANDQPFQRQAPQPPADMGSVKRAWQNFQIQATTDETAMREKAERDWKAKLAESAPAKQEHRPVLQETFRRTVPGDHIGQRRVVSVAKAVHDGQDQIIQGPRSVSQSTPLQQSTNGRASRFFGPTADRGPLIPSMEPSDGDMGLFVPTTPMPPPPESFEHPVYGIQGKHPLVNLPKVLKVKLPPAPSPTAQRQELVQMPTLVKQRSGHQPIVNQTAWQDRFNGLFGRTTKTAQAAATTSTVAVQSPSQSPNIPAAPISSSTKSAFVEPPVAISATVSLPQGSEQTQPFNASEDLENFESETKPTEEELVDEREFGSSPTVRLFKGVYPREPEIMSACPAFHRGLVGNTQITHLERANKDFSVSANSLSFEYLDRDFFLSSGVRIKVRLCGRPTVMKILPRKQDQLRKPKPRNQLKKAYPTAHGSRPTNAASNQLQANSGNGNRQMSMNKSSPKPDADLKRVDARTVTVTSANTVTANNPGEGSTGEALASSQAEKPRTNSAWAKPPKSQRRSRFNPIRA